MFSMLKMFIILNIPGVCVPPPLFQCSCYVRLGEGHPASGRVVSHQGKECIPQDTSILYYTRLTVNTRPQSKKLTKQLVR
jgi:hypothetical protein